MSEQYVKVAQRRLPFSAEAEISRPDYFALGRTGRVQTDKSVTSSKVLPALATPAAAGIKTSFATADVPVQFVSASDFDGSVVVAGLLTQPRNVTITRAAAVGSYTTDPIQVFGQDPDGLPIFESLTPADADGGDVLTGVLMFVGLVAFKFPAQVDAAGAFQLGVGAALPISPPADRLFVTGAGLVNGVLAFDFDHVTPLATTGDHQDREWALKSINEGTTATGLVALYYG
jgi:hypothetical protein